MAKKNFFWSDTYLILAEESFDKIFLNIYENEFIDKIFDDCEAFIDKEVFVNSIAGNIIKRENPRCEWLFSPKQIRTKFQSHFSEQEIDELIKLEYGEDSEEI
jgi:hypothetical protein